MFNLNDENEKPTFENKNLFVNKKLLKGNNVNSETYISEELCLNDLLSSSFKQMDGQYFNLISDQQNDRYF